MYFIAALVMSFVCGFLVCAWAVDDRESVCSRCYNELNQGKPVNHG